MIIVAKDIVLDPMRHMAASQSPTCHNFLNQKYLFIYFQSNIAMCLTF
jgi:hypothetical protein